MLLTVALGARITVAAPRTTVAELRAAICCMQHCPTGARPPMTPRRCCVVSSDATDPASTTAVGSLVRPDAVPLAILSPLAPTFLGATSTVRSDVVASRAGPPVLLDTLKLRC